MLDESTNEEVYIIEEEIDEPLEERGFSVEGSLKTENKSLETLKQEHRHEENQKLLELASMLVVISLLLLFVIWLFSVWLSPEQQKFSNIFVEILKTVILTTIGFICGNKLDK